MYKLFQFFLAHFGYKRMGDLLDLTGFIRGALAREKTHADLVKLREAAQTFITEIDMELERRGPEPPPLGIVFNDWLRGELRRHRYGMR